MCRTSVFIPPDRGREVRINGRGETIMMEIAVHARTKIDGLHHAASGQDAQQRVKVWESIHFGCIKRVSQCLCRICVDLDLLMRVGNKNVDTLKYFSY